MNGFRKGDRVALRRRVVEACASPTLAALRAVVTEAAGDWVFLREDGGRQRVLPADILVRLARNGAVLELL